jgi:hypothetical protein
MREAISMQSETIRATCRSASRSDGSCTNEGGNQHAIRDHQSYLPIGE